MTKKVLFEIENADIVDENPDSQFAIADLLLFSSGSNRHEMYCSEEVLKQTAPTAYEKPIIFEYDKRFGDFGTHNEKTTIPAGFIVPDTAEFKRLDDGRLSLHVLGKVWKKYSHEFLSVFKRNKRTNSKLSVEMELTDYEERSDGLIEMKNFIYAAACILGEFITEASPGANIQLLSFSENDQREYEQAVKEEFAITDFPDIGGTKPIQLKYSKYQEFDYDYAQELKNDYPEIWKKGGKIRGDDVFELWGKARSGSKSQSITQWIKEREAWAQRHKYDNNIAGIVACMKWGVTVAKGVDFMKSIVDQEISKERHSAFFADDQEYLSLEESPKTENEEISMEKDEEKVEKEVFEEKTEETETETKEEETKEEMSVETKEEECAVSEEKEESEETEKDEETEESEEKEEEMSLDAYLDVAAMLSMLEAETEQNKEIVYAVENKEYGKVIAALFAKAQEFSTAKNALVEEMSALKEFKNKVETEQKAFAVNSTLKEVEDVMPKDVVESLRQEAEEINFDALDGWKNKVKAQAFSYAKDKKPGDDIVRIALPIGGKDKKTGGSVWDRLNK